MMNNNLPSILPGQQPAYEREKLERLRDEFAMAVITGIYANPNRTGTCIDALNRAYELAAQMPHIREQSK